ncbi:sensor histidine kinase [Ruminiclostridium cellulolyticum]|uniref:Putative sensor with HAMP domain n=1 Tax=Ruminiclostridium cellulolyticum (strain ATCC 35319 / DSM 5812 / JCM 6584 / H10) TaxID=394503 RepID=B8I996_RUMCH|nr:sensor histidine kinase [Ruminiclostridium cellulolyticum]ACL75356.1 putative sensor with HAMP domain [Ruminiclostridium cellulolyticum H10]
MKNNKFISFAISTFNNISIKSKIFIFYAGILLASLSIFAILTINISNQAIVEKVTKNAERELSLIDKSLLNLANNSENYARILSMDNRMQNQLERIENNELDSIDNIEVEKTLSTVISNVVQPNTNIAAASIMSSKYMFFDVGYIDNSSISRYFNRDLINSITKNKVPTWTRLFKVRYKFGGDEDVFAIAKTIIGMDTGHVLGTAVLYLKEKDVAAIYLNNIVNENDKFYIVDNQKNIISTQDKSELYRKFDEELYLGKYKLEDISDTKSLIRNIGDKKVLITVQNFDKLDWKVVSVIPLDEITYENKKMTQLILIFGVTCLICAFVASYLLSYTISKPILKLVNIMKEIKSGNLKLRADLNVKGEIGMLGDGFNSLMDKINVLVEHIYTEQRLKRENEFKLLQSQIKPHFLYNTIETIISFIKLNLKDNAMLTAKYLAGFYRISLSKGNDIITIRDEMNLIDNYLSIQKMRYVEYLDYRLEFEEEILKYQIPKLTLQPLVENSIYHGLKQKEDRGILIIKGEFENGEIKIEVFDDGVGMSEENINRVLNRLINGQKSNDFGIYSVNSRLKLLYGDEYGLSIESKESEFTRVTLRLPAIDTWG